MNDQHATRDGPPLDPGGAPELSVIIAARDAEDTIGAQLEALCEEEWRGSWEVVVVDNGSSDATPEIVRRFHEADPRIRLVVASSSIGASYARNEGMDAAHGRSFAFCDADDLVEPGWIAAMGEALREHEMVAGPIAVDRLNPEWLRTAFYTRTPRKLETFAEIFPFAATCNLGVRRAVIDRVGNFDATFLTGQDLELCLRTWAAGVELRYVPSAVVQYRYRPELPALWRRSRQYGAVGPALAQRLASMGAPTPPRWAGLRQWIWLLRKLPTLRTKRGRARWLVVAGGKVGRLQGSWRSRWLYL